MSLCICNTITLNLIIPELCCLLTEFLLVVFIGPCEHCEGWRIICNLIPEILFSPECGCMLTEFKLLVVSMGRCVCNLMCLILFFR